MKSLKILITCAAVGAFAQLANASTVNQLLPLPITTTNQWYASPITGSTPGTATIVSLVGAGGNLEFGQPAGIGAARLTTGFDNNDRAGATIQSNYGNATAVMSNIDLSYSFYKAIVIGGNTAAAPSLKLSVFNPTGTGTGANDSFGQLIYEWTNQGLGDPPTNVWQSVIIDENTGGGTTASGGWWWSGGFGFAGSGAGAPFRSLGEWVTAFSTGTDAADFAGAIISEIQMGVGSFNPGMNTYFDNLQIIIPATGFADVFDFEPVPAAAPVPEPTTLALVGLGIAGLTIRTRRRRAGL